MDKIKNWIVFIVLLLNGMFCFGNVEHIAGTGNTDLFNTDLKEYCFYYHNNSDDYHWYSTIPNNQPIWAVRFDFAAKYSSNLNARFRVTKGRIYFPNIGDTVRVELWADSLGFPYQRLAFSTVPVNQHLVDIPISGMSSLSKVWMLVKYKTRYTPSNIDSCRFISASEMTFEHPTDCHSYLISTAQNGSLAVQSMASLGYNCEYNFGVLGEYTFTPNGTIDLELVSAKLVGDLSPGRTVYPEIKIYNHSNAEQSAQVIIDYETPSDLIPPRDRSLVVTIPSQTEVIINNINYSYLPINLSFMPHQLKLHVSVTLQNGSEAIPVNDSTIVYNVFADPYPIHVIENFISDTTYGAIWTSQYNLNFPRAEYINYFPLLNDEYYNTSAQQRFIWYGGFTLPVSIFDGRDKIFGLPSDYSNQFSTIASEIDSSSTFINSNSCTISYPNYPNTMNIDLEFANSHTYLFSSASDCNPCLKSKLYVALLKKITLSSVTHYIFDRWIAFQDTINNPLLRNTLARKSYQMPMTNLINSLTIGNDYVICYWFQSTLNKGIIFADLQEFSNPVINSDDNIVLPELITLYPNPLYKKDNLNVSISNVKDISDMNIKIFNIRGQIIFSKKYSQDKLISGTVSLPNDIISVSGIYLMKISIVDKRNNRIERMIKFSHLN